MVQVILAILLLLVVIFFVVQYLAKSSVKKVVIVGDGTTSSPLLAVIHDIETESKDVKCLYDVFSYGRESHGEYFYFGAIDPNALIDGSTGDITKSRLRAEVYVHFREDALSVASHDYEMYSGDVSLSALPMVDRIFSHSGRDIIDIIENLPPNHSMTFDAGNKWIQRFYKDLNSGTFEFLRLDPERVTKISVVYDYELASSKWAADFYFELVKKYKEIPMNMFSGAPED